MLDIFEVRIYLRHSYLYRLKENPFVFRMELKFRKVDLFSTGKWLFLQWHRVENAI